MRKINKIIVLTSFILIQTSFLFAGNEQRAGQAGASELLLNPWARSAGLGSSNVASVTGLESVFTNIAGTAFTNKTELIFSNSNWFKGSGININSFGITQKISETGVLSLSVNSLDFGEIDITTVALPDGGSGTYHPQYTNIGLSFANAFSNSIYGGATFRLINESISDLTASGLAIDAGIIYVTGVGLDKNQKKKENNFRFGITLKNVGPTMKYKGDGLAYSGETEAGSYLTVEQRSADFELPSLLALGVSYDIPTVYKNGTSAKLGETNQKLEVDQFLRISGSFTSNSFTKDQLHFGLEYNIKDILLVRGAYTYETKINNIEDRVVAFTGLSCGASVQIPIGTDKQFLSIEYAYRTTENFDGCHTIGARISL
jgi:hypothetical protein